MTIDIHWQPSITVELATLYQMIARKEFAGDFIGADALRELAQKVGHDVDDAGIGEIVADLHLRMEKEGIEGANV